MKNLHILPTNKPSRLHEYDYLSPMGLSKEPLKWRLGVNIYITSDKDINENDYIITKDGRLVEVSYLLSKGLEGASKVILTTDQDLIKDGVQAIDDDFLEWFVNNPSCIKVEVVYGLFNPMGRQVDPNDLGQNHSKCVWKYKIIIPKEKPKQETLEEAAERVAYDSTEENKGFPSIKKFILGAKWQQERSYSEEDMREAFIAGGNHRIEEDDDYGSEYLAYMEDWFEQFKKK